MKQVEALPSPSRRHSRINYDQLLDGNVYQLDAKDFGDADVSVVANNIRSAARSRGVRVSVRTDREKQQLFVKRLEAAA